ncbi:MAG: DUF5946 family protein [Myxococcales bacterium]
MTRCPGCGLELEAVEWPEPDGYAASRECFQFLGELSSRTLALQDPTFPHQYAVDAYAAQHASTDSPRIKTAFALIGLYLACERGLTGRAVQLQHMRLAGPRREWPRFVRHLDVPVTVADVVAQPERLKEWAASVWRGWEPDHARVRSLV